MFKVIIAGSRNFNDVKTLTEFCDSVLKNQKEVTIISGKAKGADTLAIAYAKARNYPVIEMPADWDTHGKRAGYIRNADMEKQADALIAFPIGDSVGTRHMIALMQKKQKPVRVCEPIAAPVEPDVKPKQEEVNPMITIHNLKTTKMDKECGWHFYVGRGSDVGNPFVMQNYSLEERARVCSEYEKWITTQLAKNTDTYNKKLALYMNIMLQAYQKHGKLALFCYCEPKQCHAETIAKLIGGKK